MKHPLAPFIEHPYTPSCETDVDHLKRTIAKAKANTLLPVTRVRVEPFGLMHPLHPRWQSVRGALVGAHR